MATTVVMAILFWGWRKFVKRLDENRDVTLAAVSKLEKKQDDLSERVLLHQAEDTALFNAHAQRISRNEGALEVLTAIAAAQGKEPPQ